MPAPRCFNSNQAALCLAVSPSGPRCCVGSHETSRRNRITEELNGGRRSAGAIVIGGDYQGLGIVRSLGRRGIDVVVVDDERSISRHSQYATATVRVADLRSETTTLEALRRLRDRYSVGGWVIYPTREETVAALSRHRDSLIDDFRVPTPGWDVVKRAWDKRQTYSLASELGIATPRTWVLKEAPFLGGRSASRVGILVSA